MPEAQPQTQQLQEEHKILRILRDVKAVGPGSRLELTLFEGIELSLHGVTTVPFAFRSDKKSDKPGISYMGRVVALEPDEIRFAPGWNDKADKPSFGTVGGWHIPYDTIYSFEVLVEKPQYDIAI